MSDVHRDSAADDLLGLAPVYGQALALREMGLPDEAIAADLGVAVEAIPALFDVAARKRANRATPQAPPRKEDT